MLKGLDVERRHCDAVLGRALGAMFENRRHWVEENWDLSIWRHLENVESRFLLGTKDLDMIAALLSNQTSLMSTNLTP